MIEAFQITGLVCATLLVVLGLSHLLAKFFQWWNARHLPKINEQDESTLNFYWQRYEQSVGHVSTQVEKIALAIDKQTKHLEEIATFFREWKEKE